MNQQEQSNGLQPDLVSNIRQDANKEQKADLAKSAHREWFPEDDDEWYEPDYSRQDRAS